VGYDLCRVAGKLGKGKGDQDMKPVSLKEIVDRLDFFMDGWNHYLNKKTGDIVEIQMEYLSIAEESEDDDDFSEYEDWEQDAIREAVDVVENWGDMLNCPIGKKLTNIGLWKTFVILKKMTNCEISCVTQLMVKARFVASEM
jgi:hypothetical protein